MKSKNKKLNNNQKIRLFILAFGLLIIAVTLFTQFQPNTKATVSHKKPEFSKEKKFSATGTIFAPAYVNGKREDILLPDIEVFLRNNATGSESGRTKTDTQGRFRISEPFSEGEFSVCWEAKGWQSACNSQSLSAEHLAKYVTPIELKPVLTKSAGGDISSGAIAGRVIMADGLPCTHQNKALGILQETMIEVSDKSGKTISVPTKTNDDGGFVLTEIPNQEVNITASCGKTTLSKRIQADNLSLQGTSVNYLKIDNHNPNVAGLSAFDGKDQIRNAEEGQKIKLTVYASDKDERDVLNYNFILQQNGGTLGKAEGNTVEWQLPEQPGTYNAYAVVTDNKGGVSFKTISLVANKAFTPSFSGTIIDELNKPVVSAKIEIAGKSVLTNINGTFSVGISKSSRYVMNISKAGFVPVSRIYNKEKNGVVWKIRRAFTATIDPTKLIRVTEPLQGNRKGSVAVIQANNLINRRTRVTAVTPLQLSLATLNISEGEMPGDNSAVSSTGRSVALKSYGAAFIEIRDEAGDFYDLIRTSKTNTLTLSVEPSMINTAPVTIPTWLYDPPRGIWSAAATAQLLSGTWQMPLPQAFAIINADLEFTNPACIQVETDGVYTSTAGYKARFNFAGNAQTFDLPLDDTFTMIHHVPQNVQTTVTVFDGSNNQVANAQLEINGFTVSNPFSSGLTTTPFVPPYPYVGCNQKIRLGTPSNFPTSVPNFLTFKGVGDDVTSQAYIDAVDPQNLRTTLGGWWLQNGFDQSGVAIAGTTHKAAYFNNNDLHFGREMRCVQDFPTVGDVACYVSNYTDADLAQNSLNTPSLANKGNAAATVTMEYKVIEGQATRIVKFFAYSGGLAGSGLLLSPDLDKNGPKGMPQLCLTCHGGNYFPSNPLVPTLADVEGIESSFREFDLDSFLFPVSNPRANQEAEFQSLNNQVTYSAPRSTIQDLITGWYASGLPQNGAFVPTGYTGVVQSNLYSNVVATSCRTCHVAQPDSSTPSNRDFETYNKFSTVVTGNIGIVCGPTKYMPHAKVTFDNFWLSVTRPQLLSQTLLSTTCP
jgi:hypothetical protein